MIKNKRLPTLRWRSPPPRHVFGYAGLAYIDPDLEQLTMDPRGSCPYHKSNPDILMMQSTKEGQWLDASDCVHRTSSWRVFRQR